MLRETGSMWNRIVPPNQGAKVGKLEKGECVER